MLFTGYTNHKVYVTYMIKTDKC